MRPPRIPVRSTPMTVTVTEALVLCPILADRGHITESIRIHGTRTQNETEM